MLLSQCVVRRANPLSGAYRCLPFNSQSHRELEFTMYVSQESSEQIEQRLQAVAAATAVEVLDGEWWYEEIRHDFPARVRAQALAIVRDSDGWSQLVPVQAGDRPAERFRLWCCHFPADQDNSGFVGWLASRIKAATGSGIFVVCGQNSARGGIYDYWGCPAAVADQILRALVEIMATPSTASDGALSLDGIKMQVVATAAASKIDRQTVFHFTQSGAFVSARYLGGSIRLGYLIGQLETNMLRFRFVQIDREGTIDSGQSQCEVLRLADGRTQLREHFRWESRSGEGINVIEQLR
jgi:hypothetical protein